MASFPVLQTSRFVLSGPGLPGVPGLPGLCLEGWEGHESREKLQLPRRVEVEEDGSSRSDLGFVGGERLLTGQ